MRAGIESCNRTTPHVYRVDSQAKRGNRTAH